MARILALGAPLLALAVTVGAVVAHGQTGDAPPINLNEPAVIEAGEKLYGQTCRYCHGKEGQGGRGPTLRGRGFDYRHVWSRITNGYPPMPAFNQVYTPEQVWEIVAFVQSMQ